MKTDLFIILAALLIMRTVMLVIENIKADPLVATIGMACITGFLYVALLIKVL